MGKMTLGMFQGQYDYMKVCIIYLNTQAKQPPIEMIRLAGGLFTIYTVRVAQKATGEGVGAGIRARAAQGSGRWRRLKK
jgi:hypothetical protein